MTNTINRVTTPPGLELLGAAWVLIARAHPNDLVADPDWLAGRDRWQRTYQAYVEGRTSEDVTVPDIAALAREAHRLTMEQTTDQQAGWRAAAVAVWAACFTTRSRRPAANRANARRARR